MFSGMIGKLIIGEDGPWNHVRAHLKSSTVGCASRNCMTPKASKRCLAIQACVATSATAGGASGGSRRRFTYELFGRGGVVVADDSSPRFTGARIP
jgi:hypothetical protein